MLRKSQFKRALPSSLRPVVKRGFAFALSVCILAIPAQAQLLAKGSSGTSGPTAAPPTQQQPGQERSQTQPSTATPSSERQTPTTGGHGQSGAGTGGAQHGRSSAGTGSGASESSGQGNGQQLPPIRLPQNEPLNTQPGENAMPQPASGGGRSARGTAGGAQQAPATTGNSNTTSQPGETGPGATGSGPMGNSTAPAATGTSATEAGTAGTPSNVGGGIGMPTTSAPAGTRGEGTANTPIGMQGPTAAAPRSLAGYVTVNQVLNEGLLRSPRAAAIRSQLKIQTALYAAATTMPDPQFFRDEAPISEQVMRVGAQKTWDPPWKLAFRLLAARRQVQEQKLELLNTLWGFRNDVRRAYLEVVIAQETYDTLSALYNLANRLLGVSQKLFKAGSVAELDVLKAELAARQSETDRDQGAARVALAKQQLGIIIGRGPDTSLEVPRLPVFRGKAEKTGLLPNLSKPVPPINEFMELALSNRLELRILSAQIRVAEAQLRNAWGNIIPDQQNVSGFSSSNNGPSGPKIKATFFTMNYELPLFTYSQGDIVRLKATLRQYRTQVLAQRNQISSDVTSAYNHLLIARRRIAAYEDHILAESERVARLARRSYEVGQSDITSTLAAQQANVNVRQSYLDAVNNYQQAFTELEQSIGVPLI